LPSIPFIRNLKIAHYLIIIFLILSFAINGIITFILYQAASKQMMQDIKRRLYDIVSISSCHIDGDLHRRLTALSQQDTNTSAQDSKTYLELKQALQKIQNASKDIHFIYTMRTTEALGDAVQAQLKDGSPKIMFLVDAETDPAQMANLGDIYSDASSLLTSRFFDMQGPVIEETLYQDQWGTWLSGYAPFYDSQGRRAGVLGVDISAKTVTQYQKHILLKSLMIFLITLPLVVAAALLLGRWFGTPMLMMQKGAEAIASGHLDHRLKIPKGRELSILAKSMNHMAESLHQEQHNLKHMVTKYRNIFENSIDGIFQTTPEGQLLTANSAMVKMLGYASLDEMQQAIGHHLTNVYESHDDRQKIIHLLKDQERLTGFEVRMRRKDGTGFMAELNVHLSHYEDADGEETIIEGTMKDISQRIEREKAEREKEAAMASSQAKSEFLANMSHEIRTPLNAVMGLTDLMGRTQLSDAQQQYLKKITMSSRSLLAVINDILDFSKIEAGRLELEHAPFSLYDFMANIAEMFAYKADEKGLEFLLSIDEHVPTAVIGDSVRLGQVLINLVGNALKFTEKGEIVVKATLSMETETTEIKNVSSKEANGKPTEEPTNATERFTFSVQDTGIGIPEARLDALFESFTQADESTTRKYGGTGLGLTISRHLVRLMGGDIIVTSTPEKGSCFSFTIPLECQPEKNQISLRPPPDLRGLKVLIVDDNRTALEILAGIIQSFQMEAVTASSGEEALEVLMRNTATAPFDLVLMDWKMPRMNGLEAARRIKLEMALEKTPIVCMVSAHAREDLIQQADRKFLDAFLHKPVNQSFLFDTIMELFGRHDALVSKSLETPSLSSEHLILQQQRLKGKRVLLVEDNEINREVALEWLSGAGIDVDIAVNGKQALSVLGVSVDRKPCGTKARESSQIVSPTEGQKASEGEDTPYDSSVDGLTIVDAVLMDIQMPEMDGFEATGHIRNDLRFHELPIIAMTAHALKGDREKCLDAGMNDYVTKPIDPELLFQALAKWTDVLSDEPEGALTEPSDASSKQPDTSTKLPDVPIQRSMSSADGLSLNVISDHSEEPPDEIPPKMRLPEKEAGQSSTFEISGINVLQGLFRVNNNHKLYQKLIKSFVRDFAGAEDEITFHLIKDENRTAGEDQIVSFKKARLLAHSIKGVSANIGAEMLSAVAGDLEQALVGLEETGKALRHSHDRPPAPTTNRPSRQESPVSSGFSPDEMAHLANGSNFPVPDEIWHAFSWELSQVISGIREHLSDTEDAASNNSHDRLPASPEHERIRASDQNIGKEVEFDDRSVQDKPHLDVGDLLETLERLDAMLDDDLGAARDVLESMEYELKTAVDPGLCGDLMDAMDNFEIDEASDIIQQMSDKLKQEITG
jgi:two-component system, sensor histidine kinase and response regulator